MEILKTTGIALSSHTFGEADILCIYYTRDMGKAKFIIKGLKKSKTRSRAAVEPGAIANLLYYHRDDRDAYLVNEFDVLKFYSAITCDLQKILHLYLMLEFADKTCGYQIADEAIFNLLLAGIDTLSKTSFPSHLSAFFILRLLKYHGMLSDYLSCKLCGNNNYSTFILDILDLRPICGECLPVAQFSPALHIPVHARRTSEFVHSCVTDKFSRMDHGNIPETEIRNLILNLSLFAENYFHTELKSKSLVLSDI